MAKAINWPQEFYDEVVSEDMDSLRIALRPGSIYFDNGYFTDNEVIDIRINHKIARKGLIFGDMQLLKIKELLDEDLAKYKKSLQDKASVISFLSKNYNQQINEESSVTLITYKNLEAVPPDEDDDPHM